MFAVIKTGGKQYRVSPGHLLHLEKLEGTQGSPIEFQEILMVGEAKAPTIGVPFVNQATVKATIVEQGRGEKILIYKRKRRKGYRRSMGHRQYLTYVHIDEITLAGKSLAKADGKALSQALAQAAQKSSPTSSKVEETKPRAEKKSVSPKKVEAKEEEFASAKAEKSVKEELKTSSEAKVTKESSDKLKKTASKPAAKSSSAKGTTPAKKGSKKP